MIMMIVMLPHPTLHDHACADGVPTASLSGQTGAPSAADPVCGPDMP